MSNGLTDLLQTNFGSPSDSPLTHEQQAKSAAAQQDLFCKIAAQSGYDLSKMQNAEIAHLWDHVFNKTAAAASSAAPNPDEIVAAAQAEYAQKQASAQAEQQQKQASVAFGEIMGAHAWQAFRKCAEADGFPFPKKKDGDGDGEVDDEKKKKEREAAEKREKEASDLARRGSDALAHAGGGGKSNLLRNLGIGAAGAAAAGGAAYAATRKKDEEKKASFSAFDVVAYDTALAMAKEAGEPIENGVLARRLEAALVLSDGVSTKVASSDTFPEAVQVRALELLEGAGVEITWNR